MKYTMIVLELQYLAHEYERKIAAIDPTLGKVSGSSESGERGTQLEGFSNSPPEVP